MPSAERCKKALQEDNPALYAQIYEPRTLQAVETDTLTKDLSEKLQVIDEAGKQQEEASPSEIAVNGEDKKHQSRGGKGLVRDNYTVLEKEAAKRAVILEH